MKLSVKVLQGQEVCVECDTTCSVGDLKLKILQLTNIPIEHQRLIFKGKSLQDASSLDSNSINGDCRIMLTVKKPVVGISSEASTKTLAQTDCKPVFWDEVMKTLRRHFMEEDAKTILDTMKKDFSSQMNALSLDDIERLARTNLDSLDANAT